MRISHWHRADYPLSSECFTWMLEDREYSQTTYKTVVLNLKCPFQSGFTKLVLQWLQVLRHIFLWLLYWALTWLYTLLPRDVRLLPLLWLLFIINPSASAWKFCKDTRLSRERFTPIFGPLFTPIFSPLFTPIIVCCACCACCVVRVVCALALCVRFGAVRQPTDGVLCCVLVMLSKCFRMCVLW